MTLSRARAEEAIGGLGEALGVETVQAAEAVLRVATANMVASFLPMIARYGVDHREFSLQAFGGAGPTHAFMLAAEAGIQRLVIPPAPGAMCAVGAAVADVQMDFVRSVRAGLSEEEGMEEMFSEMEENRPEVARRAGVGARLGGVRAQRGYALQGAIVRDHGRT